MLNLAPEKLGELVKADAAFLDRMFDAAEIRDVGPPRCDMLFIYADLTPEGRVVGSTMGLREIVRDSGAKIVVIASENSPESYIKAGAIQPYGRANLVMTLDRCSDSFECFLSALFSRMKSGTSMPDAWVQLSPQVPEGVSGGNPVMIFACEIGAVSFA